MGKLKNMETQEPSKLETLLATHPPTSERLARIKTEVGSFPKLGSPVRNEAAYAAIKADLPK
jgi:predicted Zn-dependent protease